MPTFKIPANFEAESRSDVAKLHEALSTLHIEIAPTAKTKKRKYDESTGEAVKKIQVEYGLAETGLVDSVTVNAVNAKLFDHNITENKYRTAELHSLLDKLKISVGKYEKELRVTGVETRKAIEMFQSIAGLPVNGKLSEELMTKIHDQVVKDRFYSVAKNQRGKLQATLNKVSKIAGLNLAINDTELKNKELGNSSVKLIEAFQEKYKLPATGKINKETLDKITSVATSKGKFVKRIPVTPTGELKAVAKELRLNTISPNVSVLQKNLSYLGYKIDEKEFNSGRFGRTTSKAITELQKSNAIKVTGHYDKATRTIVNKIIANANPNAVTTHRYRIRGSVRNELWERQNQMVIKAHELILDQESPQPIAAKKVFINGFFDIAYDAPIDTSNGQVKENFHLVIKLFTVADQNNPIAVQKHYNVNEIHWANFTEARNADGSLHYNGDYLGDSQFESAKKILKKAIGNKQVADIKETASDKQISQLSIQTGLNTDLIMQLVLSELVTKSVDNPILIPEIFYAFITQHLPADLPGDLLRGTSAWDTIAQLTELAASGIVFLDKSTQQQAIGNAITQNLVSQKIKVDITAILTALEDQRVKFTLDKPILVGNGNLKALLDISTVADAHYSTIANVFINSKGINNNFWTEIKAIEGQIGSDGIADFTTTVELANVSKNHVATVEFLKGKTGAGKRFKMASDIAKLDHAGIVALVNDNGKKVPDNMPGNTPDEKVANFAAAIKSRSEFLYPAVSLVASTKRINAAALPKVNEVEKFIDEQKDLDFREQNLDKYIKEKNIPVDKETRSSLKLVQRIHKLTSDSLAGSVLIDKKKHSSMQIYFTGREALKNIMKAEGVEEKSVHRIYESSRMQYMRVLDRVTNFRREIYRDTPAAIVKHIYTDTETADALGDIPDLETLFGSMDFCDCEHCRSLYGPPAYLADMLRFLKEHLATAPNKTVKDILFSRRPDIGNIKLNCVNTTTALPYIDLVCEILENNLTGNTNFVYQTTLSQKDLRAIPENIQPAAYTELAGKDFPMNASFNLWQDEARTYLNYLRAPRYELMEAFQNKTNPLAKSPDDVSIAAEYFNFSWKEKDLIVTSRAASADQNKYWGFDTTQDKVKVLLFMKRSKLTYTEVLELLNAKFVNEEVNRSVIERTADTCDTDKQSITNVTPAKLDRMHRFLRLWKKSGWKIWELDLLVRNVNVGNNAIDGTSLVNFKLFRQLQTKLKLNLETLLAFYGEINREVRLRPDKLDVIIQPLYNNLFQNIAITNPVDVKYKGISNLDDKLQPVNPAATYDPLVLDANIKFEVNPGGYSPVPTLLSGLAISQTEFDQILGKTNNRLSVNSLSILYRYVQLARSLKLSIQDLLLFLTITNTADPFANPQATINCHKNLEYIKASGLSILQLDYILNHKPDSSVGMRDESMSQLIEGLRSILEDNKSLVNFLNTVIAFDADALAPVNDVNVFMTQFSPLQNAVIISKTDLSGSDVSPEEIKLVAEFEKNKLDPPAGAANKITLIANIKKMQSSAVKVLATNTTQKQNQVKSHIASSFSLSTEHADLLLTKLTLSMAAGSLLSKLENENLITKDVLNQYKEINRANFGEHFDIYTLLNKSSLLVSKMKIEKENLDYFVTNSGVFKTINLSALPVNAPVVNLQFTEWLNLHWFLNFKSKFPEPENTTIRSILDFAKDATKTNIEVMTSISLLTRWDEGDANVTNLSEIETALGTRHTAANLDYTSAELYTRLMKCFEHLKHTGADASTAVNWTVIGNDTNVDMVTASQTRQAVKSKYEQDDWLGKVTPLHDELREKKRKALVEYHVDYSQRTTGNLTFGANVVPNPNWEDSNSLFKYFLIDVEMSSCQLTSRIKQALSSVQLFVQRCFLNLESKDVVVTQNEKEDVSSPNAWSQWKWMKNYRIWEANRKIFFYPENWLEPELRDDKSPFFQELESELMQNEVTKDNVEAAFLNYMYKMNEVSNLEVCGLYHQLEDLNPDEAGYETNIVHVIGRTKAIPHLFYYRTYNMNYGNWSAWEKIDEDIAGDHLLPVVYNRKLHLFWLQFNEKPLKAKKVPAATQSDGPTDSPEPMKVMEVQLGWTVRNPNGWSTKKVSKQKLVHPWERPQFSYHLKPYYRSSTNELYLDVYLSTSKEFNDSKFFDPYKPLNPAGLTIVNGHLTTRESAKNPTYITKNRFNETYLPWHSSSFIFNGELTDIEMKGLQGKYYLPGDSVQPSDTDSYKYVNSSFGDAGSQIDSLSPFAFGPRLRLPNGMHYKRNALTNNKVHSANASNLRVLENTNTTSLLTSCLNSFDLVITQQELQLDTMTTDHPFFYQDKQRAFFIKPEWEARLNNYGQVIGQNRKYRFQPFYHPYTTLFIREFNRRGFDGLLNRNIQTKPETYTPANNFNFSNYAPTSSAVVDTTSQKDIIDFTNGGSYSLYNWELFFHAPLMVACRLMQNQKFEDAMNWFHYIFNPTNIEGTSSPQRYWVTKPFFEYNSDDYRKQRIESILSNIQQKDESEIKKLNEWKNNPFKPHLVARNRPVAYQKNVVMKYLDNLIAWGDMLFKRDTIESINEASLLYVLAYEILGDRPMKVPAVKHEELTFNELEAKLLNPLANAVVDSVIEDTLLPVTVVSPENGTESIPKFDFFYFGIPANDFMTKYWDTVEDRLFKIRNCMNIAGVVRQLPLFEPPIDPAMLVKAAAAGIDISSVLSEVTAPTPYYRFRVVSQKAIEFCNEVRTLGEKLLNVLEKKDVEQLSLLRSRHEIQLLEVVKQVRQKQIDEAEDTVEGLNKAYELAETRFQYYSNLAYQNDEETDALKLTGDAISKLGSVASDEVMLGWINLIPTFNVGISGFGGSPNVGVSLGPQLVTSVLGGYKSEKSTLSSKYGQEAQKSTTEGTYKRRQEDWDLQESLASTEKEQVQFQISAAELRKAIAEKELENQELQIENAKAVDEVMKSKYTNEQLFNWMITEVSTVYFQVYQLAYDMAKKAEKCFQYELGITDSSIIQFGYWDSLKKGLLSADKLMTDLRRLEAEYINQNKREFEITKHISLAQVAPLTLITLRETGQCTVSLPEWLFDMDYPGHYMRRIKNVSISIPCIVGPFTGVNCTLSLLRNETRMDATLNGGAYAKVDANDTRFRTMFGTISSISTTHAQNDTGTFELNFNDDRYLPFEGAGVISDWQISLPKDNNYFDFASMSDVILHISYTSRSGGGQLTTEARTDLQSKLPDSTAKLFSLKHEFSTEWHKFLNPVNGSDQEFVVNLKPEHFPFFIRNKLSTLKIKKADLFVESGDPANPNFVANLKVTNAASIDNIPVDADMNFDSVPHASRNLMANALGNVSLKLRTNGAGDFKSLTSGEVDNTYLLFQLGN